VPTPSLEGYHPRTEGNHPRAAALALALGIVRGGWLMELQSHQYPRPHHHQRWSPPEIFRFPLERIHPERLRRRTQPSLKTPRPRHHVIEQGEEGSGPSYPFVGGHFQPLKKVTGTNWSVRV
jgi:hypothetical protein